MCYQTGKSIKREGKRARERERGDRGTGSKLSADWFSQREVGFRDLVQATDIQESMFQCWMMEYPALQSNPVSVKRQLVVCLKVTVSSRLMSLLLYSIVFFQTLDIATYESFEGNCRNIY